MCEESPRDGISGVSRERSSTALGAGHGNRGSCARSPRQFQTLALARSIDEARKQRMPVSRIRRELRVELRPEEPRMARQLDELGEAVAREAGEHEASIRNLLQVAVVEL